ncbi:MAG: MmgE/PrpD family protein [Nitrososphaerales archaeon]
MSEQITEKLATFTTEARFDNLPTEVKKQAATSLLDWLGVALVGSLEPPTKIISSLVSSGGKAEATIIGSGTKTSTLNAALINGVAGHSVELDDIHETAVIHPAAAVIPAALSVAESQGVNGKQLLTAIVVGYEAAIRIGKAIMPTHYKFWHTTGTCGTFGAAAAAGSLLGLDKTAMEHAFGIAGTQAAGLIETFGTMSKPLNAGKASMNGVLAAMLAQKGFTGATQTLESEKGFCRATSEKVNLNKIVEKLGEEYEIVNCIIKRHASCGHTHGAIDAVLQILNMHEIKTYLIDKVLVETYPIAVDVVGKNYEPKTVSEAKFSLPYCVAVALAYGKAGLSEFSEEKLRDSKIKTLMKKVDISVADEFKTKTLGAAKVTIYTRDGNKLEACVQKPKGYPDNPLSEEELKGKFIELARLVLPTDRVYEILEKISKMETINDAREFTNLLGTI